MFNILHQVVLGEAEWLLAVTQKPIVACVCALRFSSMYFSFCCCVGGDDDGYGDASGAHVNVAWKNGAHIGTSSSELIYVVPSHIEVIIGEEKLWQVLNQETMLAGVFELSS